MHDFGFQPLAGCYPLLPESAVSAKKYRLDLSQCAECGLFQVTNLPPVEEIFHEDYRYSSSTIPSLVQHFADYAKWLKQHLKRGARVFEFGCNDGVLLEQLSANGVQCAGIDASENVAAIARNKGLSVKTGFLTEDLVRAADMIGFYDLVTCSNVLAHIDDLTGVLRAVRLLLKPNGLFAVEVHDGDALIDQGQIDTIYHEHLTYFTEATLRSALERNGFSFQLCERTSMHGGSLRCLVARAPESQLAVRESRPTVRTDFDSIIVRCRRQLADLHKKYGRLVGYGAAGRSQMFINVTETAHLFERVYDDSPLRQSRYIVGTDIPIEPFIGGHHNCVVILAWNYAEHIARRIGGSAKRIVTLLPELRDWR